MDNENGIIEKLLACKNASLTIIEDGQEIIKEIRISKIEYNYKNFKFTYYKDSNTVSQLSKDKFMAHVVNSDFIAAKGTITEEDGVYTIYDSKPMNKSNLRIYKIYTK